MLRNRSVPNTPMLRGLLQRWLGHWGTHGVILPTSFDVAGMPTITPGTALAYTPVYRAASLIANDVARVPLDVSERTANALLQQPNRWQNGFEFRRSLTMQALLYGNAFAVINRTLGGELLELLPLDIESVSLDLTKPEPVYKTRLYGDVPMSSMLHLRAVGLDGLWGESPVRLCRTSLSVLASQEQAQLEVMKNAGNPKIAIVAQGPMGAPARQMVVEDYMKHHAGAANAGKPLVLSEGMKVERISSTLDDSGIANARRYSIEDVSRIYGVPAAYLSEQSGMSGAYGTMEWTSRRYVDSCLAHWFASWSSEIVAKLAPFGTASFDADSISQPPLAEQFAALRTGVESGIITRNEARDWLNLAPLDGLDEPIIAKNMGTGGGTTNIGSDTSEGSVNDFA
jgi:HK97 family phage portal protein